MGTCNTVKKTWNFGSAPYGCFKHIISKHSGISSWRNFLLYTSEFRPRIASVILGLLTRKEGTAHPPLQIKNSLLFSSEKIRHESMIHILFALKKEKWKGVSNQTLHPSPLSALHKLTWGAGSWVLDSPIRRRSEEGPQMNCGRQLWVAAAVEMAADDPVGAGQSRHRKWRTEPRNFPAWWCRL
jgi:hypothetical protein